MNKQYNYYIRIVIFISLMSMTQGCYHYRVSSAHFDPSTSYNQKTVHSFFWGLVQPGENGISVVANNCDSLNIHSIDEVRISTNFGYALLTVVTLGIWSPMTVEWKCAKPCGHEGEINP